MASTFYEQAQANSGLKNKRKLSVFIDSLILNYRKDLKKIALTYVFCTEPFLLDLNIKYLNHDTDTDILTFDLSVPESDFLQGEIYISIAAVKKNALEFQSKYLDELHRVIFHGALHLSGFEDKTPDEENNMRSLEDEWINKFQINAD